VIDGGQRLGGVDRVHHRHVHGREHRNVLRRAASAAACVSVSKLHSRLFISRQSPSSAHRQQEFKAGAVGKLRHSTISLQIAGQRSGTFVSVNPPSEFIEKTPSLNLFARASVRLHRRFLLC